MKGEDGGRDVTSMEGKRSDCNCYPFAGGTDEGRRACEFCVGEGGEESLLNPSCSLEACSSRRRTIDAGVDSCRSSLFRVQGLCRGGELLCMMQI
ncbi:unnamed protein product [Linum trigynum]|uniref:Uncharacterized protein n=1 Tax=Linum trigynum TaxID=586398 RepID=A0AAV2EUK9_9ROSI